MTQHPLQGDVEIFVIGQVLTIAKPLAHVGEQPGQISFAHLLDLIQLLFNVGGNLLVQPLVQPADSPGDQIFLFHLFDVGFTDGLGGLNHLGGEGQSGRALELGGVQNIGTSFGKVVGRKFAVHQFLVFLAQISLGFELGHALEQLAAFGGEVFGELVFGSQLSQFIQSLLHLGGDRRIVGQLEVTRSAADDERIQLPFFADLGRVLADDRAFEWCYYGEPIPA